MRLALEKVPPQWQWLFRPLSRVMRGRLEICLGVVLSGAAMVGLSTTLRPDPSKLAATLITMQPPRERPAETDIHAAPPAAPRVPPEFAQAVASGDLLAIEKLHTKGMPLDGMLAIAAESGNVKVASWLLAHGADVHEEEGSVNAPVLLGDDHAPIVALLLESGARTPALTTAAGAAAPNAVQRALTAGANANEADPINGTPLTAALSSTRGTATMRRLIIEKLLAAGADADRDDTNEDPLTAAVQSCENNGAEPAEPANDCLSLVRLLQKHGARTKGGALSASLGLGDPWRAPMIDALLKARLAPGATAIALSQSWMVSPRELKPILAKGVDWAWHDGEDDAAVPLLSAIQRQDRDLVRLLLDAGAPANVRYKDATCPLGAAIGDGAESARIVELLIARGADVNRRLPDGRTPLFAAAEVGDLRIVNALLDRGARVNDRVLDDTALDVAEQGDHLPVARVLHARGGRRARTHHEAD